MTFQDKIYIAMEGDSSINSHIDHLFTTRMTDEEEGDIVDEKNDTIVVIHSEEIDYMDSLDDAGYLQYWSLAVYIGSPKASSVWALKELIKNYLIVYSGDGIEAIEFENATEGYDEDEDIRFSDLRFRALYIP